MAPNSPMLIHAVESFVHGMEHFLKGTGKDRKFAILHLDQAVELMLKERCIQLGKGIYKTNGTTLTLHEAAGSLGKAGVKLPELARLEEIHDLRNMVQHKGVTPDSKTVAFYADVSYRFATRFLKDELGYNPVLEIPVDVLITMHEPGQVAPWSELISGTDAEQDPTAAVLAAHRAVLQAAEMATGMSKGIRGILRAKAAKQGVPVENLREPMKQFYTVRGRIIQSDYTPTPDEAEAYMKNARWLSQLLGAK
jgi:hypothetical protein